MTETQRFVYELSQSAFLPLWTYPNPQGKDSSKELCDVLVVCQPDIIIMSVKHCELHGNNDKVEKERWYRHAVEDSVKQIYGAERRLKSLQSVTTNGDKQTVDLGEPGQRKIHRIAVAIGSDGKCPLPLRISSISPA